ncbi:hypothetical protein S7711_08520 [Stachybotrys chartarum IBT 7711]|uniref:BZIP domain-containing protein n=1 Tax=Stachybotrys chartarum (strain CBS 109288 / IBT 7711) TaxID=1280523 RepID=A0A084AZU1_STACB|nr:hypothetical protein S7711_08520 [Stachybotrys chartarum IBT 7711]
MTPATTTGDRPHTLSADQAKPPAEADALERARLRRNQRNSRARKQAYVRSLEDRWSECVRLGAQATVEMQKEARRVQEENQLLRAMLQHQGLDPTAIQSGLDAMRLSMAQRKSDLRVPVPSAQATNSGGPSWPWPSTVIDGPAMDFDLDQSLDLHGWLNDLCDIKDAFGAEAQNQFMGPTAQDSWADTAGPSLDHDAMYALPELGAVPVPVPPPPADHDYAYITSNSLGSCPNAWSGPL